MQPSTSDSAVIRLRRREGAAGLSRRDNRYRQTDTGAIASRVGRSLKSERSMGNPGVGFRRDIDQTCALAQSSFSYQSSVFDR
jgi:hypothetical protein